MSSKMENKFATKSISKLYLKSDFADVHFAFTTNDQTVKVPAHKSVLAVASKVFGAMFFGQLRENEVVEIVDADVSAFEEFLQFFYLPEVTLTMENIEVVARLADKYDMLDCLNTCAAFLESQLTEDNMIWGYQLAISLNNQPLKQFCESRIQFIPSDAFKSEMFLQCDRAVLEHILKLDTLLCGELELFNACVEWAKSSCQRNGSDENNPENLKKELGSCFYLIRFGTMILGEIAVMFLEELHNGLFNRDEAVEVLLIKSEENFESKIFKHKQRSTPALEWNRNKILDCVVGNSNNAQYSIQNRESTWFSTNTRVLLGEIGCTNIRNHSGYSINFSSTMNLIEHNDQTFAEGTATKFLHTGTVNSSSNGNVPTISFTKPIIIHPNKMYEIRFETALSTEYYHASGWKSEVKLDEKITIKFHQNPSENDSERRGLVSSLKFNRI